MTQRRHKIIKDVAKFTLSGYFSNIFNMISAVIIRKILGPTSMGFFSELMLIFQYAKNNHFGVLNALDREIPFLNGKKQYAKVKEISDIGFSFCIISSLLVSVVLVAIAILTRVHYEINLLGGIIIIAILVILQSILSYFIVLIRTHHNFAFLSKYTILMAAFDMVMKVALTWKFGLDGALWSFIMTSVFSLIYIFRGSGFNLEFSFKLPFHEIKKLVQIGLPMLFSGIVLTTLCSMDRFFIIRFMDKTQLGFYSIATMMHEFIFLLPNLIATVLFPRFYEKYGEKNDIHDVREDYERPTLLFAYCFPIIIGFVAVTLPLLVHYVLPKFVPGIFPATILIFGTFFLSMLNMSGYLLTALNKQYTLIIIGFISIMCSGILNYIFIDKFSLGLNGVAVAMLGTYFIYGTILISYALSHYTKVFSEHLKFLIRLYLPIVWMAGVLFLINSFLIYSYLSLLQDIFIALIRIFIIMLASMPLILYIHKRTDIIKRSLEVMQMSTGINRGTNIDQIK